MSGDRRACISTEGSIFLAVVKAAALSRTLESAARPISKTGREACDIEYGIGRFLDVLAFAIAAQHAHYASSFQSDAGARRADLRSGPIADATLFRLANRRASTRKIH